MDDVKTYLKITLVGALFAYAGGYAGRFHPHNVGMWAIYLGLYFLGVVALQAFYVERTNLKQVAGALFNLIPSAKEIHITHADVTVGDKEER